MHAWSTGISGDAVRISLEGQCLKDPSVRVPLVKISFGRGSNMIMMKMVIMGITRMMMLKMVRMVVIWEHGDGGDEDDVGDSEDDDVMEMVRRYKGDEDKDNESDRFEGRGIRKEVVYRGGRRELGEMLSC